MWGWLCTHVCDSWMPKTSDPLGAGVIGSFQPYKWVLGTNLRSL